MEWKIGNKEMPDSVAEEMTQIERLVAHVENGYKIREEDEEYFETINMAFRVIFAADSPDQARKRINGLFLTKTSPKFVTKIIDDVTVIYGDFFEVNKNALRVIQEKRHLSLYHRALREDNIEVAEKALAAIDRLYLLHSPSEGTSSKRRKLPKIKRTSDPGVFIEQQKLLNGED